jgi:hypothetical protein
MAGWIKIYRKITDWEWYDDLPVRVLFLHLLVTVEYEPKSYKGHKIPAGGGVYGRVELARRTGLTERAIRRALKVLEQGQQVSIKRTNKFSIISITKWADYQDEGQQRANKGPTKGQQSVGKRATSKEKKKEEEKNNNPLNPPGLSLEEKFDRFWQLCPKKVSKGAAEKAFPKALKQVSLDALCTAMDRYAASKEGTDPRFIKHPSAWLNQKCWLDEPDKPPPLSQGEDVSLYTKILEQRGHFQ